MQTSIAFQLKGHFYNKGVLGGAEYWATEIRVQAAKMGML